MSPWIRRFHPAAEAPARLVCFPHAGGSATFFYSMSQSLSPYADVLAIQYPGRQDRRNEPGIDDIGELADRTAEALRPWTDLPIVLFGHSLGATVAFEVAVRLEHDGVTPAALFTSGRCAASRYRDESVRLDDDALLIADLNRLSGTAAEVLVDDEVLRMILPAIRNDYRAALAYRCAPGLRVSCPIVSLIGDSDPTTTVEEAQAWREHTSGAFALHVFSGGHFYLDSHPDEVTALISRSLPAPLPAA
jgi:surfactin synthase thioesterase subunit